MRLETRSCLQLFLSSLLAVSALYAQVAVTTHHNDNARTGANLNETTLNTQNVNVQQFGKLFSHSVDGEIYTQPLYLPHVTIAGKGVHNVVYVATMNDSVYAFDADTNTGVSANPLWMANFTNPAAGITAVPQNDPQRGDSNVHGSIGIMGTPVIDTALGTIYCVARTKENGAYKQRLHALDVTSGAERAGSPVTIAASVAGNGDGSVGGVLSFDNLHENQRPALALYGGIVYIMWASLTDWDPYHGWVIGYDASTLQQKAVYVTTPNGQRGGIWQAGSGPAIDENGFLYFMSGNGSWGTDKSNYGSSLVKLSPATGLLQEDYFTPSDWQQENSGDLDLGSSGPLVLPNSNLVVGGGKEGILYAAPRNNLGHVAGPGTQAFAATTGHIHGSPVYWDSPDKGPLIYVWGERSYFHAYHFNGTNFDTTAVMNSTFMAPPGMPGGFLSVSANGSQAGSGIVWVNMPLSSDAELQDTAGVLRAFNASDLTKELWNSRQNAARDDFGLFAKFTPPTVVNGKVYLSTFSNQLCAYGLLSTTPDFTLSATPASQSVTPGSNTTYTVTLSPENGWSGSAQLSVTGLPSGASGAFSPTSLSVGNSTLTISTTAGVASGSYPVTIIAAASGLSHSASVQLNVSAHAGSGSLTGSVSYPTAARNLSVLGTTDWVHWGLNQGMDRKAGVATQISNFQLIGNGNVAYYADNPIAFSWSDGTPTANVAQTQTGAYVIGTNNGFQITAPADTTSRTLLVYAGVYKAQAQFTASLSDGSAVNFVDTSVSSTAGAVDAQYSLTYQAASAGQTLTVMITQLGAGSDGNANVTLQAAALQSGGSGPTPDFTIYATPSSGTVNAGASAQYTVHTSAMNGFSGMVNLSVSGVPSGATAAFSPNAVAAGSASTLSVMTNASVAAGSYTLTIHGTSGSLAHQVTVAFAVTKPSGGGALTGSVSTPASTQNLTSLGTTDWAHWGLHGAASVDRKSGSSQIGTLATVGNGGLQSFGNNPFSFSWSNGSPTQSATTATGLYVAGQGNGFTLTAPADTTARTLTVFAGVWKAQAQITASLSDGSAPAYVDTSTSSTTGSLSVAYAITYQAASSGQTLTITFTQASANGGNVTFQAVALAGGSAPHPDFTMAANPTSQSVTAGSNTTTAVAIQALSGFSGSVALTASGVPSGVSASFSPSSIAGSGSSTLTLSTSGTTTAGSYPLTITGTSGSLTHSASFTLTVTASGGGSGGGVLTGALSTPNGGYNLTQLGTLDWTQWNATGNNVFNHKLGVTSQISNFAAIGGSSQNYSGSTVGFTWSDGTPNYEMNYTSAGAYIAGQQHGFQLTVPAGTTANVLTLYLGTYQAQGKLTATLSDGSAPTYTDSSLKTTSGSINGAYGITFRAATSGSKLTVTWTQASSGGGNVTLQAATLAPAQ